MSFDGMNNDDKKFHNEKGSSSHNDAENDKDAPADSSTGKQSDTAAPSDEENSADDSQQILKNKNDTNITSTTPSTNDINQQKWSLFTRRMLPSKKIVKCGRDLGVYETSLEDRSNCLTLWLLSFINPLLKLGSTKVLDEHDIGVPPKQDVAATAYNNTLRVWTAMSLKCQTLNEKLQQDYEKKLSACNNDENKRKKIKEPIYQEPSIAMALIKAFGVWELVLGLIYYILSALLTFVPVIILNDLLKFFQSGLSVNKYDGLAHPWVEVAALGVIPFLVSLLQTRHNTIYAHCAVFVRTAVSTMLYRKALRVSAAGRAKTSTGQVVNMMSNDTTQLQRFLQFVGMTLVAPLQIVIALVLIYFQVRGFVYWSIS
jgi:hypothetical protein